MMKMADMTVSAELKFRDGQIEKINVKVQNNLSSLIDGINDLNVSVSRLLSELVEREKVRRDCAEDYLSRGFQINLSSLAASEEDEDSDEDDNEPEDPQNSELQPPAKRSKT